MTRAGVLVSNIEDISEVHYTLEVARFLCCGHTYVWPSRHIHASLGQWRRPGSTGTKTKMLRTRRNTGCLLRWRSLPSLTPSASSRKTYPTALVNNGTSVSVRLVRILTVRFTYREDVIRIHGAGYWRKGKRIYERENQVHGRAPREPQGRS